MPSDDSWLYRSWSERWGLVEHPHKDGILKLMHAHDYLWSDRTIAIDVRIACCNLLYELAEELVWR